MAEKYQVNIEVKSNLKTTETDLKSVNTALQQTQVETDKLNNKSQEASGFGKVFGDIKNVITGMVPGLKGAEGGVNSLSTSFKALMANPVVLIVTGIVAALKLLYEAFQSSVEGGKAIKQVWAGIEAVGLQLKDAIFGLVRSLGQLVVAWYKFQTLDFKGASKAMKEANREATNSFNQLGDAIDGTTYKLIANLEKQKQANEKAKKVFAVTQSETNKLLVQSREILTDETASINAKKKALESVTKAEKASSAEKVRIAAEDLRLVKERAAALGGEAEKKMKGEIREATIALNEAETENAMTGIKLNKQRKMLLRQEVADSKTATDAKKEQLKTIQDAEKEAIEKRFELEKLSFDERRKIVNEDKKLSEKDRKDFLDKINSEERKATEDHNKAIADLNLKYDNEAKSAAAITAQEKLDLEMQNKLDEINLIAKTEKEKSDLYDKWNTEYDRKQKELNKNELLNQQSKNLTVANDSSLSFQTRLDAIKAREDAEKDIVFKSKDEQLAYEKANADATEKIEKEKAAARMAYLSAFSSTLKTASSLLGESTTAGKAAAVAATTIDTIQSGVSAFKGMVSAVPGPVGIALGAVAAAGAVASGFASVKKILAVKTPGGGGGSAPSMGGTMAPQFNVVGATGVNQLAGALSNREQQPVMAYVTANNVTTAQALDRNIITSATLG